MSMSRQYRDGELVEKNFPLNEIDEHFTGNSAVWYDLVRPTSDDYRVLAEELGLHQLAIEDSIKGGQRAKIDHYDSHLFINLYQAHFPTDDPELALAELAIFVTKHAVITVRQNEDFKMDHVIKRWDESAELAHFGVAFLLWGILDVVIDDYFKVIERLDNELEELEDELFEPKPKDVTIQKRSYQLRKSLVLLRRAAVPMREVINPLLKHNGDILHNEMLPYYQDLYDHIMRVADWTDSLRDLVTTLLETNLTLQGNRMNLVMKKVTSWAAIIAVPTAITGWFGQNVPYTGFGQQFGVYLSAGSIVVVSAILYWAFRRNDWL